MIDKERKNWNSRQKKLRSLFETNLDRDNALELFLLQHAGTHSKAVAGHSGFSFLESLMSDLSDDNLRHLHSSEGHTVLWRLWHMSRIEDITMNILVADTSQVFANGNWAQKIGTKAIDTGNSMDRDQILQLTDEIHIPNLLAYRDEVGKATREIVAALNADDYPKAVEKSRLQRILDEGAVVPGSMGLINYWGGRTIAGLLLMPPTRHNMVHLNECFRLIPRRA